MIEKPSPNKPFGNLTFSHYTVETAAERYVLALQAALTVQPREVASRSLKKLLRLKKLMQKNPIRKYSFALVQAVRPEASSLPTKEPEVSDRTDLVCLVAEDITGLSVHSKEVKVASSGHLIVKLVLVGKLSRLKLGPNLSPDRARSEFAVTLQKRYSHILSSCIVQPFKVRRDDKNKRAALSIQCLYRVANA